MNKSISLHIDKAPNKFRESYVPLFKLASDDKPYHAGTAFSVIYGGTPFLVTAAHVLDKDENNLYDSKNQIYAVVKGALTQIDKFDLTDFRDYKNILGTELDLALLTPKNVSARDIVEIPCSSNQIHWATMNKTMYLAGCGFPCTKNKIIYKSKVLTNRPYGYFGKLVPTSNLKRMGFNSQLHFGIDILIKKTFRNGLREVKAPSPFGISGGPVFVVHDFGKPRAKLEPTLRGVIIEYRPAQRMIVCVDLVAALNLAREAGLI